MSRLHITLNEGTDQEVTLSFMQVTRLKELGDKLGEHTWHKNDCGCCVSIHPKGQHDRGYVVDEDGGYEWHGPGEPS